MSEPRVRRRVRVHGRVQGVAFRAATRAKAQSCGVAGWVRNRRDGSVEAALEGAAPAVDAVLTFCRSGPRGARVERIEVREEPPEDLFSFEIRFDEA
jgi:acylphosphatase